MNNKAGITGGNAGYSGFGSGLCVYLNGFNTTLKILSSNFTRNQAIFGGGLYISFGKSSYGNVVNVSGTHFTGNRALKVGGGADIGLSVSKPHHKQNQVWFIDSIFHQNWAQYGGGTAIYAKHSSTISKAGETINFRNCSWHQNSAIFSPAVDISPHSKETLGSGFLPIPSFADCYFTSNTVEQYRETYGTCNVAGAFLVTKLKVNFRGQLTFVNHSFTPLQVRSGIVDFRQRANVLFQSNTGIQGGAIAMYECASLYLRQDSIFRFINNTARDVGGAIYFQSALTCFITYSGNVKKAESRNLTLQFTGNKAFRSGDSIFVTSLYPCSGNWFNHYGERDDVNLAAFDHEQHHWNICFRQVRQQNYRN